MCSIDWNLKPLKSSLVSETVAVFNGGDFKYQNHDDQQEGYKIIQIGLRQECMWS